MTPLPKQIELRNVPPHIESWSVAGIPKFVLAVLERWQRNYGELPTRFYAVMCPQAEINAAGGLPARVVELTDPRLRCRHFTGCHRPYFVVFFCGDDADRRRAEVQNWLSWSESYRVDIGENAVRLDFVDATEDATAHHGEAAASVKTLQDLLATGDIVRILA
jgi:hypothetical protein